MVSSSPPSGPLLDNDSSNDMNVADSKAGCFEDKLLKLITAADQEENALTLQALGIALVGDSQMTHLFPNQKADPSFINVYSQDSISLEDPLPLQQDYKAYPSSTNFSSQASSNPEHQLPSQQSHKVPPLSTNSSFQTSRSPQHQPSFRQSYKAHPSQTRKRKFQVTIMPDSPLKLRVSWFGKHPLSLDNSRYNPSEWDALAGEDETSTEEGSGTEESGTEGDTGMEEDIGMEEDTGMEKDTGMEEDIGMEEDTGIEKDTGMEENSGTEEEQYETYSIVIRPLLPRPRETLDEILTILYSLDLIPHETMGWGYKFKKPVWQATPFQSEAWKRVSMVRKVEE